MNGFTGRGRDAARTLAAVALLMTLAACGGDSGANAASVSNSPPAAPSLSAAPSPTSLPVPVAVIPNLAQAAVLGVYLDEGFGCIVVAASHSGWTRHRCSKNAGGGAAVADFEGPGTAVVTLKASAIGLPETVVEGFLGDSASLPFDGSASDQAQQWVTDSLPNGGGVTVIAGVHLQMLYAPPVASITLKPAT